MKIFFLIFIAFLKIFSLKGQPCTQLQLNSNWVVSNQNFRTEILNVTIPNTIHSVLFKNGQISDPLFRYNDLNLRYLSLDNGWTFSQSFRLNEQDLKNANFISLTFDSIDTIASIYLNKQLIQKTNNQFLQYRIQDIKSILKDKNELNVLEVNFLSPINQANISAKSYPYRMPPECPPEVQKGDCQINMLRKKQCSFSWDWGPNYPNIGINGPVYLSFIYIFDFEFSVSVYPKQKNDLKNWLLDELVTISRGHATTQTAKVITKIEEINFEKINELTLAEKTEEKKILIQFSELVDLWWPNGYGDQKMYEVKLTIDMNGQKLSKSKKIGFRSIELVQELTPSKKTEHGLTFYFKINTFNIFLKGSNWIPADVFQEKITREYLTDLFNSAKESYMNVLRIWGGGIYELDDFYDLANKNGILIWQDFMFACAAYPTNTEFLQNVQKEVKYQVNRLRHHPSILIWAANNENEAAISTDWYGIKDQKDLYFADYRKLYIETIKPIVEKYDPVLSRPYLSSSPTNGLGSEKENWLAKNPYDWNYGDMHFYDYQMNSWDPENFPLPRFMSEFGVQSLPSMSTLSQSYTNEEDMDLLSSLNEHRQHHANGNQEMINEIKNNLDMPNENDKRKNFSLQIYLTQLNQGMHLEIGSELYRRSRNFFNYTNGNGLCSGTMYWQFNDLWQAPTWASIEYGGKWKLSHYFVKRSYANLHLSPVLNGTQVTIHAISDHLTDISSNFDVKIYSYDTLLPKFNKKYQFNVKSLSAIPAVSISLDEIKKESGCEFNTVQSCVMILTSNDDKFVHKNFINFLLFNIRLSKVNNLKISKIKIENVRQIDRSGNFEIEFSTDQVSLFVWLDIDTDKFKGVFSDNGFHMVDKRKQITYKTNNPSVHEDDIYKHLTIHSLNSSKPKNPILVT